MKKIILSSLVAGTLALSALQADNKLHTHAEFGYFSTSGNTDVTAYNFDLNTKKAWDKHHLNFLFNAQYTDENSKKTSDRFLGELQYDYDVSEKIAFSYLIGYENDKFSGFNYQFYTGPGAKYKAIEEAKHKLLLEGNILYSKDEYETPKVTNDYTSVRAKGLYEWQILDNLKFNQDLSYRVDAEEMDNYFVSSRTAFTSKLTDVFSFGISYQIDYVNMPPVGAERSDKILTANLIVDY